MLFLLLDDSLSVIAALRADFVRRVGDDIAFHLVTEQSAEELVAFVVTHASDVVLMDGSLERTFAGWEVARLLKQSHPEIRVIGFSSAASMEQHFLFAGADAFVLKNVSDPEGTVERVMKAVERLAAKASL